MKKFQHVGILKKYSVMLIRLKIKCPLYPLEKRIWLVFEKLKRFVMITCCTKHWEWMCFKKWISSPNDKRIWKGSNVSWNISNKKKKKKLKKVRLMFILASFGFGLASSTLILLSEAYLWICSETYLHLKYSKYLKNLHGMEFIFGKNASVRICFISMFQEQIFDVSRTDILKNRSARILPCYWCYFSFAACTSP